MIGERVPGTQGHVLQPYYAKLISPLLSINLLKLARKEQCLALLTQLRTKFKIDGYIYRAAGTCAAALPAAALGVAAQAAAGRPPPAAACTPRRQPRRRAARSSVAAAGYNYNIDDIVYQTIKQQSWETPPEARGGADGVQPPSSSSLSPEEAEAQWEANQEYIAHCNATYGVPGLIEFAAGYGGLPKAVLQHPSGTRAEVYLHGGTVTSWRHADGREMLHLRRGNVFDGVEPIRCAGLSWPTLVCW
jgi:hypothetical protein